METSKDYKVFRTIESVVDKKMYEGKVSLLPQMTIIKRVKVAVPRDISDLIKSCESGKIIPYELKVVPYGSSYVISVDEHVLSRDDNGVISSIVFESRRDASRYLTDIYSKLDSIQQPVLVPSSSSENAYNTSTASDKELYRTIESPISDDLLKLFSPCICTEYVKAIRVIVPRDISDLSVRTSSKVTSLRASEIRRMNNYDSLYVITVDDSILASDDEGVTHIVTFSDKLSAERYRNSLASKVSRRSVQTKCIKIVSKSGDTTYMKVVDKKGNKYTGFGYLVKEYGYNTRIGRRSSLSICSDSKLIKGDITESEFREIEETYSRSVRK